MTEKSTAKRGKKNDKTTQVSAPTLEPESNLSLMKPRRATRISIDLGNGYGNVTTDCGIPIDFRSIQSPVSDAQRFSDLPFEHTLKFDDEWVVFGEAAYTFAPKTADDFQVTNRYMSSWYRRLFTYALHRVYGLLVNEVGVDTRIEPEIVMSIPAKLYKSTEITEKIKSMICGDHYIETTLGTAYHVHVAYDKLTVIPEGAGSYLSACAEFERVQRDTWLVVDIGSLTTDVVVFTDMNYMSDLSDSDDTAGMSGISTAIKNHILAHQEIDVKTTIIDRQIECPSVTIQDIAVPIEAARMAVLSNVAKRINRLISLVTANLLVAGIILTGGGAVLMQQYIKGPGNVPILRLSNNRRGNVDGGFSLLADES